MTTPNCPPLLPDHFTLGYRWALRQLAYGIPATRVLTSAKDDLRASEIRKVENGFDEGALVALEVVEILESKQ